MASWTEIIGTLLLGTVIVVAAGAAISRIDETSIVGDDKAPVANALNPSSYFRSTRLTSVQGYNSPDTLVSGVGIFTSLFVRCVLYEVVSPKSIKPPLQPPNSGLFQFFNEDKDQG